MGHLLHQFILTQKLFSLETLNKNLEFFNFNSNHNNPPLISLDQLRKKSLKMSASELKHFILNAALIFGHLIPEGNKHWKLYIILRKILHIVMANCITPDISNNLSVLTMEFNKLYFELFSLPLKPKHHFLTHYPTIMNKIGPLMQAATLRYESKHRQLKLAANAVASRVNITHTLAIKHQLQLSFRFTSELGFSNVIDFSNTGNIAKSLSEIVLAYKETEYSSETSEKIKLFQDCTEVSRVRINSTVFRVEDVILLSYENEIPCFGKILHLLVKDNQDVCFICKTFKIIKFIDHLFSFEVVLSNSAPVTITFLDQLPLIDTCTVLNRDGQCYITIF